MDAGPRLTPREYAMLLRCDLVAFLQRAFHELNPQTPFLPAAYIELMASHLEDCRTGKIRRLIVDLPPRSLKSHCVSISFVAWLLGHDPSLQIIAASYGQDLADKRPAVARRPELGHRKPATVVTRISRRGDENARCRGSRAPDRRKDFSPRTPPFRIPSTSNATSPQRERTGPSERRR